MDRVLGNEQLQWLPFLTLLRYLMATLHSTSNPNDFCRRIPFVLLRKPSDTFDTWKHGNSVIYDEILNEMRYLRVELYIIYD